MEGCTFPDAYLEDEGVKRRNAWSETTLSESVIVLPSVCTANVGADTDTSPLEQPVVVRLQDLTDNILDRILSMLTHRIDARATRPALGALPLASASRHFRRAIRRILFQDLSFLVSHITSTRSFEAWLRIAGSSLRFLGVSSQAKDNSENQIMIGIMSRLCVPLKQLDLRNLRSAYDSARDVGACASPMLLRPLLELLVNNFSTLTDLRITITSPEVVQVVCCARLINLKRLVLSCRKGPGQTSIKLGSQILQLLNSIRSDNQGSFLQELELSEIGTKLEYPDSNAIASAAPNLQAFAFTISHDLELEEDADDLIKPDAQSRSRFCLHSTLASALLKQASHMENLRELLVHNTVMNVGTLCQYLAKHPTVQINLHLKRLEASVTDCLVEAARLGGSRLRALHVNHLISQRELIAIGNCAQCLVNLSFCIKAESYAPLYRSLKALRQLEQLHINVESVSTSWSHFFLGESEKAIVETGTKMLRNIRIDVTGGGSRAGFTSDQLARLLKLLGSNARGVHLPAEDLGAENSGVCLAAVHCRAIEYLSLDAINSNLNSGSSIHGELVRSYRRLVRMAPLVTLNTRCATLLKMHVDLQ